MTTVVLTEFTNFGFFLYIRRYQKLWKQYSRMKHLVANKPKVLPKDREKLRVLEDKLQEIRLKGYAPLSSLL